MNQETSNSLSEPSELHIIEFEDAHLRVTNTGNGEAMDKISARILELEKPPVPTNVLDVNGATAQEMQVISARPAGNRPSLYQHGSPLMPRMRVGTRGAGPIVLPSLDQISIEGESFEQ